MPSPLTTSSTVALTARKSFAFGDERRQGSALDGPSVIHNPDSRSLAAAPVWRGRAESANSEGRRACIENLQLWLKKRSVEARPREPRLAFGLESLDRCSEGGLPTGAISELVARGPSVGADYALHRLLASARARGWRAGLLETADSFDPGSASPEVLSSLLWVRVRDWLTALRAADQLAQDGNLRLIVLDLRGRPGERAPNLSPALGYRLQQAVERTDVCLLVLAEKPLLASARVRLQLEHPLPLSLLEDSSGRPPLLDPRMLRLRLAA
jgi:hypothetical protein